MLGSVTENNKGLLIVALVQRGVLLLAERVTGEAGLIDRKESLWLQT
jgi:hypothetical protein